MKNLLNSVKVFKPKKNRFDLSHDVKLTCNMGELVPICCIDAVPGESYSISCENLIRFAPMLAPVMHRIDVTMHYFAVPKRLLWDNFENYRTNTKVGGNLPAAPYFTLSQAQYSRLMDYMGLPPVGGATTHQVSPLPFYAYQMIYNEYYRDQNLVSPVTDKAVDGDNNAFFAQFGGLRNRAWEHDYFTAALPFAQKGDAVDIPLGNVVLDPNWDGSDPGETRGPSFVADPASGQPAGQVDQVIGSSGPYNRQIEVGGSPVKTAYDPDGTLLTEATTINDLRRAEALQKFLEKLARGGSRMTEFIRTIFGHTTSDARLQRPEYITGTKSPVVISEVLDTAGQASPVGSMAGHGVSVSGGQYGNYFCEEDCYIIGIMSVMPKTAYSQGIPKHFLKVNNPYELYLPDFANIGEQEILNKELYAEHTQPNEVFGYIPRYTEYKVEHNRIAGDFRGSLEYWHMGRKFSTEPNLNSQFITSDPTHRIFAVTDPNEQKLYCQVYNKISKISPMPIFGTPTF